MGYLRNTFRRMAGRLCRTARGDRARPGGRGVVCPRVGRAAAVGRRPPASGEQPNGDPGVRRASCSPIDRDVDQGYPVVAASHLRPDRRRRRRRSGPTQVLPDGLLYRSYLAGVKEPRLASQWVSERGQGGIWDITLGGRVGILRYGTQGPFHPQGWQLDIEGAAMPRLDFGDDTELTACDYRFGFPLTYARGNHQTKFGYYHLSSHLGDEYMLRYPDFNRINYSRDALVLGHSIYLTEDVPRLRRSGGRVRHVRRRGAGRASVRRRVRPRAADRPAARAVLRRQRPPPPGRRLRRQRDGSKRPGLARRDRPPVPRRHACYVGKSDQYEFYDQYESKVGLGVWYDF